MQLSIGERVMLLNIWPQEKGDILVIKAARQFREELSPSPEEVKDYNIVLHDNGRLTWENAPPTEVDVPDILRERVASVLRGLSSREALGEEHLPLWDKFIGDEDATNT